MNEALNYLYYIYDKFLDLVFNQFALFGDNVTVGWIAISVIVFYVLIGSILNIPKRMHHRSVKRLERLNKNGRSN